MGAQAKGKHGDAEERAAGSTKSVSMPMPMPTCMLMPMNAAQRADSLQLLFMDF